MFDTIQTESLAFDLSHLVVYAFCEHINRDGNCIVCYAHLTRKVKTVLF